MIERLQNLRPLLWLVVAGLILSAGCPPKVEPKPICAGKVSAGEALSALDARSRRAGPFKANGQCLLEYHVEGKKKEENIPVKFWVNPPSGFYLQGDVAFDGKGLLVGSNEKEFWLWIRPKEVSSYWWGLWAESAKSEGLVLSPRIVLETLGIAVVGEKERYSGRWTLSKDSRADVLEWRNDEGVLGKRIYLDPCDSLVRRIEYIDATGRTSLTAELGDYRMLGVDSAIPLTIRITQRRDSGDDSVRITINPGSLKETEFSPRQLDFLFSRPAPKGFEHVYRIVGGLWNEQQ